MKIKFWQILSLGIMLLGLTVVSGQETINFVTYGANGDPKEGDNDSKQIFFIKIDENFNDSIILELFDIDCIGENDQSFTRKYNSQFKFSLFGGKGAFTAKSITSESSRSSDLYSGTLIKELIVSNEIEFDDKWIQFEELDKYEGEFVNGAYYFKLVMEGLSGDDANVFNIRTISSNSEGIEIFNYLPTIHLLTKMDPVQLRFNSGENSSITVKNYDADGTQLFLITPYRNEIKLKSSSDGDWKSDLVKLREFEKNEICAIQFGPGAKKNNDAVFIVNDEFGNPIPIKLPITSAILNHIPVNRKTVTYKDCNLIVFDASKSYDIEKEKISFKWIFPDGKISEEYMEEVRFPSAGKYSIVLAIKDNSTAVESGSFQEFDVIINELPKAIAGEDIHRTPNEKIDFNGTLSYDHDGKIIAFDWDFGDGTGGSGNRVVHSYDTPGFYKVKLTVTDNFDGICNSNADSFNVWINEAPIANSGDDINCSIDEIVFFDGGKSSDADGNLVSYQWTFGDGEREFDEKVSHSFSKAGKYTVSLKVTDNSSAKNNSSSDNLIVWVNNPPIAKAGKDIEIAVDELFTLNASKSTDKDGEITEFVWTSGGQFEKSDEVATHAFTSPGKYEIKLKVKDASGTKSEYDEDVLIVTVNAPPIAVAGTDVYQTNSVVEFDAGGSTDSDGEIIKYSWNFGDGSTSNSKSVMHNYKNTGEYKVTLSVHDNSPASNNSSTDEIKVVINAKPIADAGPNKVVAPGDIINFSSFKSIDIDGSISLTEWTLENEVISNENDFNYSIDKPGSYNLQLRVADNSKHQEAIDFDNVTIIVNKSPIIISNDFYKIAVGETINFDASNSFDSDGSIEKYEWSLNNKVISNTSKFKYQFMEAGNYKLILKVIDNSNVSNSISEKSIDVFVNNSPTISYLSDINSCSNSITLSASESFDTDGDVLSYSWDLGDGTIAEGMEITHYYKTVGSFPIILTVDDGNHLSNSRVSTQLKVKINSAPMANAGADETICTGDIITLDASESYDADGDLLKYEWDFGDSTSSNGITVNKNYNTAGLYSVVLKVSDNSGLECNYSYDTKILRVVESPVAFAGEDIIACSSEEVFFNAYKSTDSDGIVNSFMWDFGDGTTGGGEKTTHAYKQPGVYNVILTITGEQTGECDNVDTDRLVVTIEEAPSAEFTYLDSVAVNDEIEFNPSQSVGHGNIITNYHWSFGDGSSDSIKMVKHKFIKSGNYIVELIINTDSESGCNSSSIRKSVYVNDRPNAVAESHLSASINQVLMFDASKSFDPNGQITQYKWSFGDGTIQEGINVFHSYKEPRKYKVVLTVVDETNLSNNSASQEYWVEINSPPTGRIELPEYGFVGYPILISGKDINDIDGNIEKAVWLIGDYSDSSSTEFKHIFTESGKHDILYEITDNKNATTLLTKSIMIHEIPKLIITNTPTVCIDEKIKLKVNYTIDDSDIKTITEWHFENNKTIIGSEIETKFDEIGIQKIEVILLHPQNISDVLAKKEIEIYVNRAPIAKISDITDTFIGGANDNILFDASESYDPDGNSLIYEWDMGDGNKYEGVKVFHTYFKPGNYKVKLKVSDNMDCNCSESIVAKEIKIVSR